MVLSTKTKVKLSLGLIVIILLVISGSWAYYKFYVKTPSYTIKTTVTAIKEHDWNKFQENVDVDSLSDSVAQPLLLSAMDAQGPIPNNAKEVISNWIKMFKSPVIASVKQGIQQYVEHGNWDVSAESQDSDGAVIDPKLVLEEIGLTDMQLIDVDTVNKDEKDPHIAYANVIVKQDGIDKKFALIVKLQENSDGYWKIIGIKNFEDFLKFVKANQKEQMNNYLQETEKLYSEYSKTEAENENKLSAVLAAGTLGDDNTRKDLGKLIDESVVPQLKDFKDKLAQVKTPAPAKTLQHLRLQVIDNKLAYFEAYGKWLSGKNIDSLKKATESLNNYQTMEEDATALLNRITTQMK